MKPLINISLLTLAFFVLSFSNANFISNKVRKVVLDGGHGGKDSGALGANHTQEKKIAFAVTTQVGSMLKIYMPEVSYLYTREEDQFVSLLDRARLANKEGADLFVSIHANASSNPNIKGTETFVLGISSTQEHIETVMRENKVINYEKNAKRDYRDFNAVRDDDIDFIAMYTRQNIVQKHSIEMANIIEKNFGNKLLTNRISRGVKQANLLVLWKTYMPSVLIEVGYLTNSEEEKYLDSEEGINETASVIFRSIREYKEYIEK
ncbi:N-acetylmuramoyl-L-alanine amidase family protein [Rhodoflexus sp.]